MKSPTHKQYKIVTEELPGKLVGERGGEGSLKKFYSRETSPLNHNNNIWAAICSFII